MTAKAYCPASITLLFKIHSHPDPLKMGSTGVGFTLNKGVTATAHESKKTIIYFNDKKINFPTVLSALSMMTSRQTEVKLQSPLPLGCGFGLSGASTLATCFAINKLFDLKFIKQKLIEIAYIAETLNKTGLGSVTTQTIGGFLIKKTPGPNPAFTRLPFVGKKLFAIVISKRETSKVLKNTNSMSAINSAFELFKKSKQTPLKNLDDFIDASNIFAQNAKLITNKVIKEILNDLYISNSHATITMLGQVVITTKKPKKYQEFLNLPLTISKDAAITL